MADPAAVFFQSALTPLPNGAPAFRAREIGPLVSLHGLLLSGLYVHGLTDEVG